MPMWLKVKGLVHVCFAPPLGEHCRMCMCARWGDVQSSESICHLLNAASVAGAADFASDAA